MNSDGEQTEDSDSSLPCLEEFEFLDGVKVELAFHANMSVDMVCIDSGSNRLVLLENDGMTGYQQVHGRTLDTIQAAAALIIEGIGSLGICSSAMHVPEASANLLPTVSNLVKAKATILRHQMSSRN